MPFNIRCVTVIRTTMVFVFVQFLNKFDTHYGVMNYLTNKDILNHVINSKFEGVV
jgi:hypothetical protein